MNLFFDLNEISTLTSKAELDCLTQYEHSYLQKMIAAQTVINQYIKTINEEKQNFQLIVSRYYSWIYKTLQKKNNSSREKTDLFLLKNSLEKINYNQKNKENCYSKPCNHYQVLKHLADIWNQPLQKESNSIRIFLSFFMETVYGIPKNYIDDIFHLIFSDWKLILSPLGSLTHKKFSLSDIEDYFFGKKAKPDFSVHFIDKIDRHFSVVGVGHKNHIFISKVEDFDLFEAALVVHEFQHIEDALQETHEFLKNGKKDLLCENLYLSEKSALNAERVFLLAHGTSKRGRFHWLESNLFYPILLLKCEFHNLLFNDIKPLEFAEVCTDHGMEPLPLSSLIAWGAPFQMSAYCASAMELEQNWLKFLQ
ncbi:hypothetical protein [Silvanigrella aquatica]|uniref:Uncharacterized protein n=1 Tax=Silvanigrella aquatica TaxID=1915309 RepID=A0A1L4CZV0_9BACT|nr:hypothetical protein [Silvanigrella aquatica]APJ03470.1 hypothetical protein AXG55_05945 [Silvanigrella aquatica]